MPDLLTHLLAAHAMRRVSEIRRSRLFAKRLIALFFLGAILPDLFNKPLTILFNYEWVYWLTMPTHTPIGCLFLCYVIVMLTPKNERSLFLGALLSGCGLHLGLDLLQKHISSGGYFWLFPFSWKTFQIPLFWPSQSIRFIPVLLLFVGLLEWKAIIRRRKGKSFFCNSVE